MEYVLNMFGICIEYVLNTIGYVLSMHRICIEYVLNLY